MAQRASVAGTRRPGAFARVMRGAMLASCGVGFICSAIWGVLALVWFDDAPFGARIALASAFGLASLASLVAFVSPRLRWRALAVQAVLFGLVLWRWLALEPSNDRDWLPENSRLAHVSIDGDRITVHDIRNFDYRTETEFTPQPRRLRVLRQLSDRQCQSRHRRCGGHPCALPARIARRSPDARADRPAGPAPGEPGR